MSGGTASTGGTSAWGVVADAPVAGPADFAVMAGHWRAEGAQVIGGCCRIGPAEIKAISDAFPPITDVGSQL